MSRINEKMGLKPAGKRSMMKLPDDRAMRCMVTSVKCPACGLRYARLSLANDGQFWCTWCNHHWPIPEGPA